MIPPVPPTIKDTELRFFLEAIRTQLNKSLSLESYTTARRDALGNWKNPSLIWNETTGTVQVWNGLVWTNL